MIPGVGASDEFYWHQSLWQISWAWLIVTLPNLALNSDPACTGRFPLLSSSFRGFVRHVATGWAG
jgi:hypothetical protein